LEDTRDSSWIKMEDSVFLAAKSLLDYANNGRFSMDLLLYCSSLLSGYCAIQWQTEERSFFNFNLKIRQTHLVPASLKGFTKVAFFAYNRMEDLLKANSSLIATDGLPSRFNFQNQVQPNDLINSRILSAVFVSTGKDLIKSTGKQFPLSQPILINFK